MLPKISCYNDTCWFVHDMRYGEHIARVEYKDPKIEAEHPDYIFYRCVTVDQYDAVRHHYWTFIPEWNMYRCNISVG